jgi:hypothetical protein
VDNGSALRTTVLSIEPLITSTLVPADAALVCLRTPIAGRAVLEFALKSVITREFPLITSTAGAVCAVTFLPEDGAVVPFC